MNIVILEDETTSLEMLRQIIEKLIELKFQNSTLEVIIATSRIDKVLDYGSENNTPTLYFLDIVFPDNHEMGLDVCRKLKQRNRANQIVFLTGHLDAIMYAAEKLDALNILHKDSGHLVNELYNTMNRALDNLNSHELLTIKNTSRTLFSVYYRDIYYFEKINGTNKVLIVFKDGDYVLCGTSLAYCEQTLIKAEGFVRCHGSYIVNTSMIISVNKGDVLLCDSRRCYCSERLRPNIEKYGTIKEHERVCNSLL